MTPTEKGRARQRAMFEFLGQYAGATTTQLAKLIWGGDQRLAREHLLRFVRSGHLRRFPHPLYRNGPYVYTRTDRASGHSQKILHHLAMVDFYLTVVRQLGHLGARVVAELPWAHGLIPDQTVLWRDKVWAVEHHLSGPFAHLPDYARFMEEEAFSLCHWWKESVRIGLLVLVDSPSLESVRRQVHGKSPSGLTCRVGTRDGVLRDPAAWLRVGP